MFSNPVASLPQNNCHFELLPSAEHGCQSNQVDLIMGKVGDSNAQHQAQVEALTKIMNGDTVEPSILTAMQECTAAIYANNQQDMMGEDKISLPELQNLQKNEVIKSILDKFFIDSECKKRLALALHSDFAPFIRENVIENDDANPNNGVDNLVFCLGGLLLVGLGVGALTASNTACGAVSLTAGGISVLKGLCTSSDNTENMEDIMNDIQTDVDRLRDAVYQNTAVRTSQPTQRIQGN